MQDVVEIFKQIRGYIRRLTGIGPFKVIDPANSYSDKRFYAIQAKDGNLTYSATTSDGDNISSSSTLSQDATLVGEFESISVDGGSSGSAIVYIL